MAVPLLYTEVQ